MVPCKRGSGAGDLGDMQPCDITRVTGPTRIHAIMGPRRWPMKRALLPLLCLARLAHAEPAPICDGVFHYVPVPGVVCGDGSPGGYEYVCQPHVGRRGPLAIWFDGGGACWDADSCDCQEDPTSPDGHCAGPSTFL